MFCTVHIFILFLCFTHSSSVKNVRLVGSPMSGDEFEKILIEQPTVRYDRGHEVGYEAIPSMKKNSTKMTIDKEEVLNALFKLKGWKRDDEPSSKNKTDKNYRSDLTSKKTDSEESNDEHCETPGIIHEIQRLNRTKTTKNGKVFLITKVVKSRKCKREGKAKKSEMQRRTFNIIPTLSSFISIPWLTKKTEENDNNQREFKAANKLTKKRGDGKIQTDIENVPNSVPAETYNADKLKTILNLFTIVKFDNGECFFSGLKGTCLHQIECQGKGGKPIGTCAKGFGICCYVERTCGERTRENCTYFVNEGFPKPSLIAPKVCNLIVEKAHPEVEQLRLEFIVFELRGPSNGTCISDRFTVTGHNTNHVVPDLCGINNEQHVYIDVDESNGPFNLNIITMGEDFPRTFQIKVTQIKKGDELLAPRNCLQYYTEPTGIVQTFNYQYNDLSNLPQAVPGYFNNLNYVICVKKRISFCSISYENEERESANDNPTFQLLNTDQDGERLLPPNQGGAEVFDCPDDYIIVNGVRLCGERLNDATVDVDYTRNSPVTDFSNGPFILQVRTNNVVNGRGFYLKYRQNPCLQ